LRTDGLVRRAPRSGLRLTVATATAAACLATSAGASAAGVWLASASLEPVEQRVAVAATPARTTLWTSLRFVAPPGPVAIVLPVPSGAAVDASSDAWLEALDAATAMRVFPPRHASATCAGGEADAGAGGRPFHLVYGAEHVPSLGPSEVAVLDGPAAVVAWAEARKLALGADLAADLGATGAPRFVAVRLDAPGGEALGPTLRITAPSGAASLPLGLVRAGASPLRVTAFFLGAGRAEVDGLGAAWIDEGHLAWSQARARSNFDELATAALDEAGPAASITEASSHAALAASTPIDDGRASIDGAVVTYLERAAAYAGAGDDTTACIAAASGALASGAPVGVACAKGALAAPDGAACVETSGAGLVAPGALACGAADDLAIALAGARPSSVWLTRHALRLPAASRGVDRPLIFAEKGELLLPTIDATHVDASGCPLPSGGAGSGGSATGANGHGPSGWGSGSSSGSPPPVTNDADEDEDTSTAVEVDVGGSTSCDGSSSTSSEDSSSSDSCGGDSSSSDSSSGNGCSSNGGDDGSSGDSCGGSSDGSGSSGDSCGGSSSGSSGGDSCSSGSSGGGESCSGGSSGGSSSCAIAPGHGGKRRPVRASPTAMALFALLALLRRVKRPRRGAPT
jgi:hypothetical protein